METAKEKKVGADRTVRLGKAQLGTEIKMGY